MDTSQQPLRVEGVDRACLEGHLETIAEHFRKHVDELDYRNFEFYLSRASLSFTLGRPHLEVIDDLFLASRCLHKRGKLHLERHPTARFLTRRVLPLEVGLISGQPSVIQEMGTHFGLPLTLLLASDASYEVHREAGLLSSFFSRGKCLSHRDLGGLGALVYAGAIAAVARGFDDEALLALNIFNNARQPFLERPPPEAVQSMLMRYDGLCLALVCLLQQQYQALGGILGELLTVYLETLQKKHGEEKYAQPPAHDSLRHLDLSIVAVLAMAALRKIEVELPEEGPIAAYRGFVEVFMTAPQRAEDAPPELDAETRRRLREMGMDPDQMEANLRAQAEAEGHALNEAMAVAAGAPPELAAAFAAAAATPEGAEAEAAAAPDAEQAAAAPDAEQAAAAPDAEQATATRDAGSEQTVTSDADATAGDEAVASSDESTHVAGVSDGTDATDAAATRDASSEET